MYGNKQEQRYRREGLTLKVNSLVGSHFRAPTGTGVVVAEPVAGTYLVDEGQGQRLVHIDEMNAWRFFDRAQAVSS
jgi:hypothetical protein